MDKCLHFFLNIFFIVDFYSQFYSFYSAHNIPSYTTDSTFFFLAEKDETKIGGGTLSGVKSMRPYFTARVTKKLTKKRLRK